MMFDGNIHLDRIRALERLRWLLSKNVVFEIKQKRKVRSLKQNSYLHLILGWFALQTGYTTDEAKTMLKRDICPEIFEYIKNDSKFYKSTAKLDTKQATIVIDKFRNWSVVQAGIYLPAPNEDKLLEHVRYEVSKYGNAQYL